MFAGAVTRTIAGDGIVPPMKAGQAGKLNSLRPCPALAAWQSGRQFRLWRFRAVRSQVGDPHKDEGPVKIIG
jgi:hypothetical protein